MQDILTKAVTKDSFMRIYMVTTKNSVNKAQKLHSLYPVASAALGRCISAGIMMGAMLKDERSNLTIQFKGDGPLGTVLVVANAVGEAKGYVNNPAVELPLNKVGKLDVGRAIGKGTLSVIKDLRMKDPYIGQVPIQTGEVGDDLAYYFMQSEQTPSVIGLGVLVDRDYSIKESGGFIIQVMPDCDELSIKRLEKRIREIENVTQMLSSGMDGEQIIRYIMKDFEVDILETKEVKYNCDCSCDRMERAIISLGKKEIQDMIDEQQGAEIVCHFCNRVYNFSSADLNGLMERSKY